MTRSKLKTNYIPETRALIFKRKKPSMVSVNLTDKCNQNCIYCEIGGGNHSTENGRLTSKDLFWIIDQMHTIELRRLSLCGGEPFLFLDIVNVVSYAQKKNIRCNITSNGMTIHKLTKNDLEKLNKCKTEINISIDSFSQDIQATTRGNDHALSNALKSIQVLQEYDIPVTVLSAISKYNYKDLFDSFISAYELGVKQVLYQPIIYYSNYPDRQVLEKKPQLNVEADNLNILNDQLRKIHQFENRHKVITNVYRLFPWINDYINVSTDPTDRWFFFDVLKKFYCREAFAVIDISYTGGIQPCGLALAKKSIKNYKNTDLLTQWQEATSKLKFDLRNRKYPLFCNGCCHKFSRNMLASVVKYPIANRRAMLILVVLISKRIFSKIYKKLFL